MVFNSLEFLIFFAVVTLLYFKLPYRLRWMLLLAASCLFYSRFIPIYLLILVFTILIDYASGIAIQRSSGSKRKLFLCCSIAGNLSVLLFFKYYEFLRQSLLAVAPAERLGQLLPPFDLVLPIGLSFHTFQAMSYVIEVYRGRQTAERNLGILALYVLFFPQLVAGPIERPQNLIDQFRERHDPDPTIMASGLSRILLGLFKKAVIADRLAVFVNRTYGRLDQADGPALLLATLFFTLQLYADFSGYCDIAVGSARVMGFRLMENFQTPYFAPSLSDFWRRWHISLSHWFRDYVFIPMGGSRVSGPRRYLNLMTVFLLSGLWHGANWTFVAWGAWHGVGMILLVETRAIRGRLLQWLGLEGPRAWKTIASTILTFSFVSWGFILFRAQSLTEAFFIMNKIVTDRMADPLFRVWCRSYHGQLTIAAAVFLFFLELANRPKSSARYPVPPHQFWWARWAIYASAALAILNLGVAETIPFIYLQF